MTESENVVEIVKKETRCRPRSAPPKPPTEKKVRAPKVQDEEKPKRPRGRPRLPTPPPKPPKEPVVYKTHDPHYRNNYYHEKMSFHIKCPFCMKEVVYQKMSRHINTNKTCNMLRMMTRIEKLEQQVAEPVVTETVAEALPAIVEERELDLKWMVTGLI